MISYLPGRGIIEDSSEDRPPVWLCLSVQSIACQSLQRYFACLCAVYLCTVRMVYAKSRNARFRHNYLLACLRIYHVAYDRSCMHEFVWKAVGTMLQSAEHRQTIDGYKFPHPNYFHSSCMTLMIDPRKPKLGPWTADADWCERARGSELQAPVSRRKLDEIKQLRTGALL
jgi:hypothetical protein